MLVLMRNLSYTPDVLVKSFSYIPDASINQEFLLHFLLMLDLVRCFSEEFLLQTSCSISGFSEEVFLHS